MNRAEREITCSRNDCLPHRQRAGGYTTRSWATVLRARMKGREVCPTPTGLQLVCRIMISLLNSPPPPNPNKCYQINTNTAAPRKKLNLRQISQLIRQLRWVSWMNCWIRAVCWGVSVKTALVYLQRTARSFAFSSSSTGRLKWVLMSSVIEELIQLFGEHLWAAVLQKFLASLRGSYQFQTPPEWMQAEHRTPQRAGEKLNLKRE